MSSVFAYNGKILLTQNGKALTLGSGRRLPDEYQEVKWIGATGTQYINPSLSFNDNFTVEGEFAEDDHNGKHVYAGSDTLDINTTNGVPANTPSVFPTITDNNFHYYKSNASVPNKYIQFDEYSRTYTSTYKYASATATYIFRSQTGTPSYAIGKVKWIKYTLNNIETAYLVPCYRISDDIIGMYDIIRNSFYTNAGSGTFTKGANV